MNDLSMHILDIIQNSVSAGAARVTLTVDENPAADLLTVVVGDDGRGMTREQVSRLEDPFFTSRLYRKVGMGIPLLAQTAAQSGGYVHIDSELGKGTVVSAVFGYSNIDRPPLGDVANVFMITAASHPEMDFELVYRFEGEEFSICTEEIRSVFGNGALRNLTIVKKVEEMLKENIAEIRNS